MCLGFSCIRLQNCTGHVQESVIDRCKLQVSTNLHHWLCLVSDVKCSRLLKIRSAEIFWNSKAGSMKKIENVSEKSASFSGWSVVFLPFLSGQTHCYEKCCTNIYWGIICMVSIFQGNIEQKLRQHKSSVQRVHPCSLYNSCYYWTPFGARSLVTSVITQKAYFWKKLLQLQVQCFLFCFSMKILKKSVTYEFGVLAHHLYKSQWLRLFISSLSLSSFSLFCR